MRIGLFRSVRVSKTPVLKLPNVESRLKARAPHLQGVTVSFAIRAWPIGNHSPDYSPKCTPLSPITITNHTRDKQIGFPLHGRPGFCYLSYGYRTNWTPLIPLHYKVLARGRVFSLSCSHTSIRENWREGHG